MPVWWNSLCQHSKEKKYRYKKKKVENMKINIIYPKSEAGWIIYKFAKNVHDQLISMGYDSTLNSQYDSSADINHYFSPNNIGYSRITKVDCHTTFMITHVDTKLKLDQIKSITTKGAVGICMSLDTRDKLISSGVDRDRICYINPAQDSIIKPRKIVLGFTNRVYSDNRKKDSLIVDVCKEINPEYFCFRIMGSGWEEIVDNMRSLGFEVDYYNEFDKELYNELIPSLDYYCYFGFDEGSMGFLDALAAGIGTIVTPQGYHLDSEIDITYPVNTKQDIINVLQSIQAQKEKSTRFAKNWTWENYTLKHLEIWKYLLQCEDLSSIFNNRGEYLDGIFSLMVDDLKDYKSTKEFISEHIALKRGDSEDE